jgi:hypothetical protein
MEDLKETGFEPLLRDSRELRHGLKSLIQVRLAVRCLAKLHAASLGTDWLKLMPKLKNDIIFDGPFWEVRQILYVLHAAL